MKLLDANVVIYSEGTGHDYRNPCRKIMDSVDAWPGEYGIDTETLPGILHVYSSRGEREKGRAVTERVLALFLEIISITTAKIRAAMQVMAQVQDLTTRDAIHAAVVFEHGLEGIVSADRDYDRVPGLQRFDPIALAAG